MDTPWDSTWIYSMELPRSTTFSTVIQWRISHDDTTNKRASVASVECSVAVKAGHSERMKKHVLTPLRWKGWEIFCGFRGQQRKQNEWVLNKAGVKRELLDTVKARKLAYYGHTIRKTRKMPWERDNARNNARCTQARKTTHGLDGQHQYVDMTPRGRVNQSDGGQR